jgi:hypothetical protein
MLEIAARAVEEGASNAACVALAPNQAAHSFLGILRLSATADWISFNKP